MNKPVPASPPPTTATRRGAGAHAYPDVLALVAETSPWSRAAIIGARLAARWGGSLTGCYIAPDLRLLRAVDTDPSVLSLLYRPDMADMDLVPAADFVDFARDYGIRHATWIVARTGIARTLRQPGAWHDLAVFERDMVGANELFDVLGEALLVCRMPCLVLPPASTATTSFGRIAIGWNGSIEATRAIHVSLPLLAEAGEVRVLDGSIPREDSEDGLPPFDPYTFLSRHGVPVRMQKVHVDAQAAGAALLEEAGRMHADLLIMGAYSHSRMRERVLGGATRHVLAYATLPVLMQH